MKKSVLILWLLIFLLFAGCAVSKGKQSTTAAAAPSQTAPPDTGPTDTEPVETEPAFTPGIPCEEPELSDEGVFVWLFSYGDGSANSRVLQWSYRFDDVRPIEYDPYASPVRFDGDKSLWTTYERDGESDNCLMGRCISTQAEWDFIDRVLLSAEYEADPDDSVPFGTPVFILRRGTDCAERTTRIPPGRTGYIDDEVSRYHVTPDGNVLRCDADGSVFRAVTPLAPETAARLYLIYESYYKAWTIQCPCVYHIEEPDQKEPVLLVRTADKEFTVPKEQWTDFLSLVSVEEDKEVSSDLPCFKVVNQLYALEEYPSPEVLRFTFFTEDYDPDSVHWWRWLSLREDGRIILENRFGVGSLYNIAFWNVICPVRYVSKATFDVDAICALVLSD